uniref:Histidine kinase n=1 Tax=viral metagenome TaxID=1070528 RepID=A0A6C0BPF6_9ZZZZ
MQSSIGKWIDEALQMQTQGHEKVDIICHLLKGLFLGTPGGFVAFLEPHQKHADRYYVHTLGIDTVGVLQTETLICEKLVTVSEPPLKKPQKRWSFHQKSSASAPVLVQTPAHFRVYDCRSMDTKEQLCALPHVAVHNNQGRVVAYDTHVDKLAMQSVANTLYVIQKLYRAKHKDRKLQDRVFHEIVQTMSLPLMVFDVRSTSSLEMVIDPKKVVCTFVNPAFKDLISRSRDALSQSDEPSGTRTGLDGLEVSPQDQQYHDEDRHVFCEFLSHPKVYETFQRLMQKEPIAVGGHSGSLERHAEKIHHISETLALEYGDAIIPKNHYEMDIFRANGTRMCVVLRDVSERIQHLKLMEQVSKAKSDFLANINHEFRTPLNSLDGNLQLLARTEPLSDRQRDLVQRMRLAETVLMNLLQEVLDYAKLEQQKVTLQQQSFSLRECVQAAIDVMQVMASEKRNQLSYHFDIDVPALIVGDSWRVQQILVNLISNANTFTENGVVRIEVHRLGARELRFDVIDTGEGIDPTVRESLFVPWVQSTVEGKNAGMGLGLVICKELCTLMGGRIWVESTFQEETMSGTTISFTIYADAVENAQMSKMATRELAALKGKQILLLHPDNENRRTVIKSMLQWKIRPTSCTSAEEVRDFLDACDFDAIVIGEICHSCNQEVQTDASQQELIALANWITLKRPRLPMIATGDADSIYDDDCNRLFRKVIATPIEPNVLFHLLVNLFLEREQDAPPPAERPKRMALSKKISDLHSIVGKPLRCLVVEDVEANRQVLVEMLNCLDCHQIQCVENGQEMLDAVERDTFDVVFLDLLMPVMGGMEAVKLYRQKHAMGTRPFMVAVTATTILTKDKSSYQKAGMDAFLQKPIKMNELKTLLEVIKST